MAKLNQIIAVEKGIKSGAFSKLTDLNKMAKKPELFNGFVKKYEKKDEEGEDLPNETKRVQMSVSDVFKEVETCISDMMNITARKDFTNCEAKADVVVDGKVLVAAAPVSFLLFLEKTLTDLRTFFGNLPILEDSDTWIKDSNLGLYVTSPTKTHRTKKVQKPIVLYPHSPEHPAQTQLITEDVLVGYWNHVKYSGAIPKTERAVYIDRIEILLRAIKEAREQANTVEEVDVPKIGTKIFSFVLGA